MELKDKRYKNVRLVFKEEGHKYYDTLGNENYKSTTTLLHDYSPKFDKKYWLRKKSKELGITEKQLEKQWKTITDEACTRGTNTHDGLEQGIKGASQFQKAIQYLDTKFGDDDTMITVADIPDNIANYKLLDLEQFKINTDNKYPMIYEAFEKYANNGYKIYAEIGIFLLDYLVSGMIDVLLIKEDGSSFIIGDWKTNRGGLHFTSGYYKKDKTCKPAQLTDVWIEKDERLLPPLVHMPNCNGSLYNLQLSLYAYAVEYILGIPCRGLWLCHIDSDFELNEYGQPKRFPDGLYHVKENPVEKTMFHVMPYRKQEIELILNDRLIELNKQGIKTQYSLGL